MNTEVFFHNVIDPFGYKFSGISFVFLCMLEGFRYPFGLLIYGVLLFHWVEIYQLSMKRLHEAEMLSKIKRDYDPGISIEDILQDVKFIHRWKIPIFVIVSLFFAFRMIASVLKGLLIFEHLQVTLAYTILNFIAMGGYAVGYIYFGVKVYRLMPKPIDKRMKKLTIEVAGLAIWTTGMLISITVLFLNGAFFTMNRIHLFFAADFLFHCAVVVTGAWLISIYALPVVRRVLAVVRTSISGNKSSTAGAQYLSGNDAPAPDDDASISTTTQNPE
jgi:hypothetical protein